MVGPTKREQREMAPTIFRRLLSATFLFAISTDVILAAKFNKKAPPTTTIADQYDSIVAYDAPDGNVLYFYETRRSDACQPGPDFGSGAMPFGVGYHYFYDTPVTWSKVVAGSYECADECYRNDCKEFKIVMPYYSGRGRRPPMTCFLLWRGCFPGTLEAPILGDDRKGAANNGGVMSFGKFRIYKPHALYTYFTSNTVNFCGGSASGDLFQGGLQAYSAESCASLCLFYATKVCAAFSFDSAANRCYLKTVNCTSALESQNSTRPRPESLSKVESEAAAPIPATPTTKPEFYVRKPWLSEKYDFQDLIRFDQTECTYALPGGSFNFSRPDEPAQMCRKEADCVGFQCFQYCRDGNMPTPWECTDWDPDVDQLECNFILNSTPCHPGYNNVPGRRASLFVRHDFIYTRTFIPPEFYHRFRRSTTTTNSPTTRPGGKRPERAEGIEIDASGSGGSGSGNGDDEVLKLRRMRKAFRLRRLRRLLRLQRQGYRLQKFDPTKSERFRRRLMQLRKAIRKAGHGRLIAKNF